MKHFALILILFSAWTVFATLDGSQANKIVAANSALVSQGTSKDVRVRLDAAITNSVAAIKAVQQVDAGERNRLSNSLPSGSAASPLLTSLISYWNLNEESGTRADSVTATANNLTDNNTVTFVADGKQGNAANFVSANNESLSIASNSSLVCGDIDFTFGMWIRLTDKAARYFILGKRGAAIEYELEYSQGKLWRCI
jgi:hypothetical protein